MINIHFKNVRNLTFSSFFQSFFFWSFTHFLKIDGLVSLKEIFFFGNLQLRLLQVDVRATKKLFNLRLLRIRAYHSAKHSHVIVRVISAVVKARIFIKRNIQVDQQLLQTVA